MIRRALSERVAVSARGLRKRYGPTLAVAGIDFTIRERECVGLLGPNGAGKTTTVRMITGATPLDEGSLEVLGVDVSVAPRAVKRRMGLVPQDDSLDTQLTVLENLIVFARFFSVPRVEARRRADELLREFSLEEKRDARVDQLSGGMRRRLLVARALVGDPELLVLDEPTTGLDPNARRDLWEKLARLKAQGVTQILTTHYMDEAEKLCDRILFIDRGRVVAEGTPRELVERVVAPEVLELTVHPEDRERLVGAIERDPVLARAPRETLEGRCVLHVQSARALEPRLDRLGVRIEDAHARRATLEDAFLKLTGQSLNGAARASLGNGHHPVNGSAA